MPLLVTHPTLPSVLLNGSALIKVCGGPSRSIQVNSDNAAAVSLSKDVDLSHAGPNDPGACTTGTGGDFAVFGGPTSPPAGLNLGTTGRYDQPAAPLRDPYENIPAPAIPPAGTKSTFTGPGCPVAECTVYSPGLYNSIIVKNDTALFRPGLYYINGSKGFGNAANGNMLMATGYPPDPQTGSGMVVYNTGAGIFDIGANSTAHLLGSDNNSFYEGLLFFQDRDAVAQTHSLGGGGDIVLTGTLYMTNWLTVMQNQPSQYQTLESGWKRGDSDQRDDRRERSEHGRNLLCDLQPGCRSDSAYPKGRVGQIAGSPVCLLNGTWEGSCARAFTWPSRQTENSLIARPREQETNGP